VGGGHDGDGTWAFFVRTEWSGDGHMRVVVCATTVQFHLKPPEIPGPSTHRRRRHPDTLDNDHAARKMPHSFGYRARTRDMFKRGFKGSYRPFFSVNVPHARIRAWPRETVDVPHQLPRRRHRRHQGQRCPAKRHAPQILPRVRPSLLHAHPRLSDTADARASSTTWHHTPSVSSSTRSSATGTSRSVSTSASSTSDTPSAGKSFWTG
jgi:hypothetical protein